MAWVRAIGTMSGTSMDGVDVALVETDGRDAVRLGPTHMLRYADDERRVLRDALAAAVALTDRAARPGPLAQAEALVTARHRQAVADFMALQSIAPADVDVVGFHGQTVLHRPAERLTVQIGDGPGLARELGLRVAYDFRATDVDEGGQGAPLVPAFHRALVAAAGMPGRVALLNVGGVANVTWIEPGADPVACDVGPGNALLDDLMLARTGRPMDRHGAVAARGLPDETVLATLLSHPFFALPPPKSLDRNAFSAAPVQGLSLENAAATLTAFTAAAVALTLARFGPAPDLLVVCGGGARNPILVRELVTHARCRTTTADALGWSSDAMEAQAFGYLAARVTLGLPITFPTTTGAPKPLAGGRLATP